MDEAVAIRELKRFATDQIMLNGGYPLPSMKEKNGKKVAVVGSGPAGLTCAYHLARMGYAVTIFERLPVAGGMLAVGIPDYRLPRDILDREIKAITDLGVELHTNVTIGKDVTYEELSQQGYEAVFVAAGAHDDIPMAIEGEDLANVVGAADFLREVNLGKVDRIEGRVMVVGGGNAAIDAARSALRLGAANVDLVYRRRREDMPAYEEEIAQALDEGVQMHFLVNPTRLSGNGKVSTVHCVRMRLGDFDRSGRRSPVPSKDAEFQMEADMVVTAIGQRPEPSFQDDGSGMTLTRGGTLTVSRDTLRANDDGLFAGGDVVSGPATVIDAINHGIKAACAMDSYLGGTGVVEEHIRAELKIDDTEPTEENPQVKPRVKKVANHKSAGAIGFEEVEPTYSEEEARSEACRCLRCDLEIE
jgi:NADH-quinone oxidoreductase subunit F